MDIKTALALTSLTLRMKRSPQVSKYTPHLLARIEHTPDAGRYHHHHLLSHKDRAALSSVLHLPPKATAPSVRLTPLPAPEPGTSSNRDSPRAQYRVTSMQATRAGSDTDAGSSWWYSSAEGAQSQPRLGDHSQVKESSAQWECSTPVNTLRKNLNSTWLQGPLDHPIFPARTLELPIAL